MVFVIILVTKKSRQKGLGQGLSNGCKPRADNWRVLTSNTVKPLYVVPVCEYETFFVKPLYVVPVCEYETTYYRWYNKEPCVLFDLNSLTKERTKFIRRFDSAPLPGVFSSSLEYASSY
jgi:hypothetical protein